MGAVGKNLLPEFGNKNTPGQGIELPVVKITGAEKERKPVLKEVVAQKMKLHIARQKPELGE